MKRALLIVDRGSREPEVRQELQDICTLAKSRAGYDYAHYCFLEVLPPFIEEGISNCIADGAEVITIMPYFLYPGMKLKDTVKQSARIGRDKKLKMAITRPLSYHPSMPLLVAERIKELKREKAIGLADSECDVLLIGHGSSDKNAHDAFMHLVETITPQYQSVQPCFLELDRPNIEEGIARVVAKCPKVILMMPYFLYHYWDDCPCHPERAREVDFDDGVCFLVCRFVKPFVPRLAVEWIPGVVDKDVYGAKIPHRLFNKVLDACSI